MKKNQESWKKEEVVLMVLRDQSIHILPIATRLRELIGKTPVLVLTDTLLKIFLNLVDEN